MSIFFPVSEFFEDSGNSAATFTEAIRDGIVTTACSIWSNYPGFVTKGTNPASSFARGYMNQVCNQIQPPVPPPAPPFSGGQCCDLIYDVTVELLFVRCNGVAITPQSTRVVRNVIGKIINVFIGEDPIVDNVTSVYLEHELCSGERRFTILSQTGAGISFDECQTTNSEPLSSSVDGLTSFARITNIATTTGVPDTCGNPPSAYPPILPPSGAFDTPIVIDNPDGLDNSYDLRWNQTNNNYNFPMSFRFGGIDVLLDLSGLTLFGDRNGFPPSGLNDSPPPGSEPGRDETGKEYNDDSRENEYPTIDAKEVVESIESSLEYLVCEEGVIETIVETVNILPGITEPVKIIVNILGQILKDLCEQEEGDLAFPEVYPVLPGTSRPSIMLLYKVVVDGTKTGSTYSTTVSNPSQMAIQGIDSMVVPTKQTGNFRASLKLTDGSRISASGLSKEISSLNLSYLITLVDTSFVPPNPLSLVVFTEFQGVAQLELTCTQIEYYPAGKASGVSPSIKRFVDLDV